MGKKAVKKKAVKKRTAKAVGLAQARRDIKQAVKDATPAKKGRPAKYRGKLRTDPFSVRLTRFTTVQRFACMEDRGLSTFYDYVEELIREDAKRRLGIVEGVQERKRREAV